jgi:hypothetical protein
MGLARQAPNNASYLGTLYGSGASSCPNALHPRPGQASFKGWNR